MPADPKHHSGSHYDADDEGLFSKGRGRGKVVWHLLTIADKQRKSREAESGDADNC